MIEANVTHVQTDPNGNIVATVVYDGHDPLAVYMQPEALGARLHGYQLDQPADALDAVIREHAVRLGHVTAETGSQADEHGGLHPAVTVTHRRSNGATAALKHHHEAITAAHHARKDRT